MPRMSLKPAACAFQLLTSRHKSVNPQLPLLAPPSPQLCIAPRLRVLPCLFHTGQAGSGSPRLTTNTDSLFFSPLLVFIWRPLTQAFIAARPPLTSAAPARFC